MRTAYGPSVTRLERCQTFVTMRSIEFTLMGNMSKARAISEAMPNTFSISGNGNDAIRLWKRGLNGARCRIVLGGDHETNCSLREGIYRQTPMPLLSRNI